MIIATSKSDALLKRALGRNQTTTTTLERMCDQFKIDPTTAKPAREAYVVTNEDISSSKNKMLFEQSLATKHPMTKIIFINKSSKPIYANGFPGIDAIMQKPKVTDIPQTITKILAISQVEEVAKPTQDTYGAPIPEYTPQAEPIPPMPEQTYQPEPVEEVEPLPIKQQEEYIPNVPVEQNIEQSSVLLERIKNVGSVADVSIVAREMDAVALLKDLSESNSTYAGIEEKLTSLKDVIYSIMADSRTTKLEDKLSKIYAVMHDKNFFSSKGNTIIEQRLEEVVDLILNKTSSLLQSRLDEIDTAVRRAQQCKDMEMNSARLAGLNEQRANIIIELTTLEAEIASIYKSCDSLIIDCATHMSQSADDVTGNEMINTQLKARGQMIVSDETLTAIRAAFELASDKVPDSFKEMKIKIVSMIRLLNKLFELDQEVIAAQQAVINYLKAHNVEDTVVAQSVLKKALRVYVGPEGVGTTIIPYLLSKYKSRQNANVLILDITGHNKYDDYGIAYTNIDSYLADMNQKEFMLVAGKVDNSIEAAQRIVTTLLHAADYYRVINVVMSPEQEELFQTIAVDVLSVNFITDTNAKNIKSMRSVLDKCSVPNVGKRVIINKCDVPVHAIVKKLGLEDRIDWQLCTVKNLPAIIDASLNGYDPYGISSVDLELEEVIKHA